MTSHVIKVSFSDFQYNERSSSNVLSRTRSYGVCSAVTRARTHAIIIVRDIVRRSRSIVYCSVRGRGAAAIGRRPGRACVIMTRDPVRRRPGVTYSPSYRLRTYRGLGVYGNYRAGPAVALCRRRRRWPRRLARVPASSYDWKGWNDGGDRGAARGNNDTAPPPPPVVPPLISTALVCGYAIYHGKRITLIT